MTYPASGKAERFPGMAPSFYVAVDRFGAALTPEQPAGKINVTDPDCRTLKTARGFLQGYNAQAVCASSR